MLPTEWDRWSVGFITPNTRLIPAIMDPFPDSMPFVGRERRLGLEEARLLGRVLDLFRSQATSLRTAMRFPPLTLWRESAEWTEKLDFLVEVML